MNEDYVSFDLAKKLKEKGFKELCLAYYTNDDTLYYNYSHKAGACYKDCYLSHNLMPKDSVSGKFVDAPIISQVLKWLREEKNMHIMMDTYSHYPNNTQHWGYEIINLQTYNFEHYRCIFNSYEDAAIAAIEYVLNNLV